VPPRVPRVPGVPEGQAALELAALAAADGHGVGAPSVEPAPLVGQAVCLAALRVLYLYVGGGVGEGGEKLAIVQRAPRGLHAADQGDGGVDRQLLAHWGRSLQSEVSCWAILPELPPLSDGNHALTCYMAEDQVCPCRPPLRGKGRSAPVQ